MNLIKKAQVSNFLKKYLIINICGLHYFSSCHKKLLSLSPYLRLAFHEIKFDIIQKMTN